MTKLLTAAAVLALTGVAHAQPATAAPTAPAAAPKDAGPAGGAPGAEMVPPKPGAETEALKPFSKSTSWTNGKIPAGAYGPGTPEMTSRGHSTCKWILNNLAVACDIDSISGVGKQSMHWKGHWVYGWDFTAREYRGYMAESMGSLSMMKGHIDGTRIVWETPSEVMMMGHPTKMRVTMDSAGGKLHFIGEHTVAGKWTVDEEWSSK